MLILHSEHKENDMDGFWVNPWFIGFTASLISGIIVFFITNFLVSKKEKKLYKQKIGPVNFEILQTIRPLIINQERFNNDIFDSIISSLANKHNVATKDLYSLDELCNDVITDIIQTPFLTAEQKDAYSSNLLAIKTGHHPKPDREKIIYINKEQRSAISSRSLSFALAVTTAVSTMIISIISLMDQTEFLNLLSSDIFKISSIGIPFIVIPIAAVLSISISEQIIRKKIFKTISMKRMKLMKQKKELEDLIEKNTDRQ